MLIVPDADLGSRGQNHAARHRSSLCGPDSDNALRCPQSEDDTEIDGEISVVSADLTQEQRTGASYYTARVLLKAEELAKLGSAKLVPGMSVDVFVKTPSRTALSYLIKPLQDQEGAHSRNVEFS